MATSQQPGVETPVRERLSWKEICARYPNEWVVLAHVEWQDGDADDGEIVSAGVYGHSKQRFHSLRETREALDREGIRSISHRYTGELELPENISLFLYLNRPSK